MTSVAPSCAGQEGRGREGGYGFTSGDQTPSGSISKEFGELFFFLFFKANIFRCLKNNCRRSFAGDNSELYFINFFCLLHASDVRIEKKKKIK